MPIWKSLTLAALSAGVFVGSAVAPAQVSIGVNLGGAPACPYGYYDYAPYNCSPYGYYGSDWFSNGVFIGAGPWFHGNRGFYGHVDNRYDPNHGYRGPMPNRGDQAFSHFQGNEARDGQGHVGNANHPPSNEHSGGFQGHGSSGGGGDHGGGGHR